MIAIDGLAKSFGKHAEIKAVAGVSLRAADGEITGLLGPNGAGKTTLLRMLATADDARRGTRDDRRSRRRRRPLRGAPADRRAVRRARALSAPHRHARTSAITARLHGLGGAALAARIDALFAVLGLADIADRRAQGFSQGERMKVAIARALVHDPHTFLLDEPTNGLDIMSTRALRVFLRGLRAAGKCLLFSSHVMQEVSALCDRS